MRLSVCLSRRGASQVCRRRKGKFWGGEGGGGGGRPLDKAPTFSADKATHLTRGMRLQVVPFRERSLMTYLIVT